jgi:hypothetical protein
MLRVELLVLWGVKICTILMADIEDERSIFLRNVKLITYLKVATR